MRHTITNLNALDMARILLLFEGATLFVLGIISAWFSGTHFVLTGALVGLIGTLLALSAWHALKLQVRGTIGKKPFAITRINTLQASIANAVFLILLFWIEQQLPAASTVLGTAAFGFSAVALALLSLFLIYNIQPLKLEVKINKPVTIKAISARSAILAGAYEAVILPIMAFLFSIPVHPVMAFTISGIVSGFIGGFAGTIIFNHLASVIKPWIDI